MSDLIQSQVSGSLVVRNIEDLSRLSTMLAKGGFFADARDAAQCGVKVLAGLELGIGAFASMNSIHIIKGKPSLSANVMAAMVKRSQKYNYKVQSLGKSVCKIEFLEKFDNGWESIGVSEMSMADAQAVNLDKDWDKETRSWKQKHNWKTYPQNMLFARAMSNGVKWFCPDIFFGSPVYTPEELGARVDEEGEVIREVVEVEESQPETTRTKLETVSLTENNQRILVARQLLGMSKEGLVDRLSTHYGVKNPVHLAPVLVDELICWMAIEWAVSLGWDDETAEAEWSSLVSKDCTDEERLNGWMAHIKALAEEDKAASEASAGKPLTAEEVKEIEEEGRVAMCSPDGLHNNS